MSGCKPPCVEEFGSLKVGYSDLTQKDVIVSYYNDTDTPCSLLYYVDRTYSFVWALPDTVGGLDAYVVYRRKWNYVKSLYQSGYQIDGNGDWYDNRTQEFTSGVCGNPTPNMAARLDNNRYKELFHDDLFTWTFFIEDNSNNVIFERFLQWQYQYGTSVYANLPQYKKHEHVGHCWAPCPYSTDSDGVRSESMLGFTPATKNDHGIYYMKTEGKGGVWGFECTYDGCPYYTGTGKKYFYV